MEIQLFIDENQIIIPNTIVNTVIAGIILSILAITAVHKAKKADIDEPPSGFMNLIEIMVESINNMVVSNMGERNTGLFRWSVNSFWAMTLTFEKCR